MSPGIIGARTQPGAGDIEAEGSQDEYAFEVADADTKVFIDQIACFAGGFSGAELVGPAGVVTNRPCSDEFLTLDAGAHVWTIKSINDRFGEYQFRILEVPEPDGPFPYPLGTAVSDGFIGGTATPGVGNIEAIGAEDIYTFTIDVDGTQVFIDQIVCFAGGFSGAELRGPAGVVTNRPCSDEFFTLDAGAYTWTIKSVNDRSGTYEFAIRIVPPPDGPFPYPLGTAVSDGFIGGTATPGVGNIEAIGAEDIYTFTIDVDGTEVFIDQIVCFAGGFSGAELRGPAGVVTNRACSDEFLTLDAGAYTWTIKSVNDRSGTYEFAIRLVPPPDGPFPYPLDTVVSDGFIGGTATPGVGNIEAIGAEDIYTFTIDVDGTEVFIDQIDCFAGGFSGAELRGPAGVVTNRACSDEFLTLDAGAYTWTIKSVNDRSGTYEFAIRLVPPPDGPFPYPFGALVAEGFIGTTSTPGAANIEAIGGQDIYTFTIDVDNTVIFIDQIDCFAGGFSGAELRGPDGSVITNRACSDEFFTVDAGEYTWTIKSINDRFGDYEFIITASPPLLGQFDLRAAGVGHGALATGANRTTGMRMAALTPRRRRDRAQLLALGS